MSWSYNPAYAVTYAVWASSISLATTLEITFVFSSYAYLDVSVQHVRAFATCLQQVRFPHSEITGSIHICWSPVLIAAYHVLHRLWEPRHPPCTLSYFLLLVLLLLSTVCLYYFKIAVLRCKSQEARAKTSPDSWFFIPDSNSVPTVVFSFYLLLPICQRTYPMCRFQMCGCADDLSFAYLHIFAFAHSQVENNGFEPLTPCVQGRCSSQLS
jgi:hypothetical protein